MCFIHYRKHNSPAVLSQPLYGDISQSDLAWMYIPFGYIPFYRQKKPDILPVRSIFHACFILLFINARNSSPYSGISSPFLRI